MKMEAKQGEGRAVAVFPWAEGGPHHEVRLRTALGGILAVALVRKVLLEEGARTATRVCTYCQIRCMVVEFQVRDGFTWKLERRCAGSMRVQICGGIWWAQCVDSTRSEQDRKTDRVEWGGKDIYSYSQFFGALGRSVLGVRRGRHVVVLIGPRHRPQCTSGELGSRSWIRLGVLGVGCASACAAVRTVGHTMATCWDVIFRICVQYKWWWSIEGSAGDTECGARPRGMALPLIAVMILCWVRMRGAGRNTVMWTVLRAGRWRGADGQTVRNKVRRVARRWRRRRSRLERAAWRKMRWGIGLVAWRSWRRSGGAVKGGCKGAQGTRGKVADLGSWERRGLGAGVCKRGGRRVCFRQRNSSTAFGGSVCKEKRRFKRTSCNPGLKVRSVGSEAVAGRVKKGSLWKTGLAGCLLAGALGYFAAWSHSHLWLEKQPVQHWMVGFRFGEALHPGPYTVGGASSSGGSAAGAKSVAKVHVRRWVRTDQRGDGWRDVEVAEGAAQPDSDHESVYFHEKQVQEVIVGEGGVGLRQNPEAGASDAGVGAAASSRKWDSAAVFRQLQASAKTEAEGRYLRFAGLEPTKGVSVAEVSEASVQAPGDTSRMRPAFVDRSTSGGANDTAQAVAAVEVGGEALGHNEGGGVGTGVVGVSGQGNFGCSVARAVGVRELEHVERASGRDGAIGAARGGLGVAVSDQKRQVDRGTTPSALAIGARGTVVNEARTAKEPTRRSRWAGFDDPEGSAEDEWGEEEVEGWQNEDRLPPEIAETVLAEEAKRRAGVVGGVGVLAEREVLAFGGAKFSASRSFEGAVEGYVFKKGDRGVGYYEDTGPWVFGGPAVSNGRSEGRVDGGSAEGLVVIRLAEYLGIEPKTVATLAVEDTVSKMRSGSWGGRHGVCEVHQAAEKVRKRRRGRREVECEERGELEKDDTAMGRVFKQKGLWAIDQVNPNGGKGLVKYLQITGADMVCGQEVKRFGGHPCAQLEQEAKRAGWAMAVQPCGVGKQGCPSAGTAVAVRSHLGMAKVPGLVMEGGLEGRLSIEWVGSIVRGGVFVGSIYLHSGEGMSVGNVRLLEGAAKLLMNLPGPWVVAGDFQVDPAELVRSGFPRLAKGVVVAPNTATCGNNTIDYFVVSENLVGAVHSVTTLAESPFDPHSPVRLLLRAGSRKQRARVQVKLFGIPAVLPSGCLNRYSGEWFEVCGREGDGGDGDAGGNICGNSELEGAEDGEEDVDLMFARCMAAAERVWEDLVVDEDRATMALWREKAWEKEESEVNKDTWSLRGRGARFVWVPAAGRPAINTPMANRATMMWASVVRCLKGIATTKKDTGVRTRSEVEAWRHVCRCRSRLRYMALRREKDSEVMEIQEWLKVMFQSSDWAEGSVVGYVATAAGRMEEVQLKLSSRIHDDWRKWLVDGPAGGIGRQHRFLRTPQGWIPSTVGKLRGIQDKEMRKVQDDHDREFRLITGVSNEMAPLGKQDEAEELAEEWGGHWGEGQEHGQWEGGSDRVTLTELTVERLDKAAMTFPIRTGLGWDGIHPRAVTRLPHKVKVLMVELFSAAERVGRWPAASHEVVVCMLAKPSGGFRPINLFGLLQRLWTRIRREDARDWEKKNDRPYMFAGEGRPANTAAWLMAARAELAVGVGEAYAQAQLDLVKAFEYVVHRVLATGARKLAYPPKMLILSLAAYTAPRRVTAAGVMSREVRPTRGIGAGAGLATFELKLVVIPIMDEVVLHYVFITLTMYVDDTTVEANGNCEAVVAWTIGATSMICRAFEAADMLMSETKNVVLASRPTVGKRIEEGLRVWNVRWVPVAKALGVGMGAGVRRGTRFLVSRMHEFGKSLGRYRRLRRVGIDTAKLVKGGGLQRMMFGLEATGVPDGLLHAQRRRALSAAMPGVSGGTVDEVLFAADLNGGRACTDPAFAAHEGPIGAWAEAIWRKLLDRSSLKTLIDKAKVRVCRASRIWTVVNGPASAMLASASRLGWEVKDAWSVVDDVGREISFEGDSPAAVRQCVRHSVARWRMRRVGVAMGADHDGKGELEVFGLEEAFKVGKLSWWKNREKACLRSTVGGRQWPQSRLHAAGLADEAGCQLCKRLCEKVMEAKVGQPGGGWWDSGIEGDDMGYKDDDERDEVGRGRAREPTVGICVKGTLSGYGADGEGGCADLTGHERTVARLQPRVATDRGPIPRGTFAHRHWFCPVIWQRVIQRIRNSCDEEEGSKFFVKLRSVRAEAQQEWVEHWEHGKSINRAVWERAVDVTATAGVQEPAKEATFHWKVRAEDISVADGELYSDASGLDGQGGLGRLGWAFAVVRPGTAEVTAAAHGVPPRWVDSVPKAEAWGLLMAVRNSFFVGRTATLDCLSVVQVLRGGRKRATHHGKVGAKLWNMIFPYFDDEEGGVDEVIRWMPAHKGEKDAAHMYDSRGQPLTVNDVRVNALVDEWAKEAVEEHRAPVEVRRVVRAKRARLKLIAMGIGLAGREANEAGEGGRDAATFTTGKGRKARGSVGGRRRTERSARSVQLGGHKLERAEGGWGCAVCGRSSKHWHRIAYEQCAGNKALKWALRARRMVGAGGWGGTDGAGHIRFLSDDMVWCDRCGATATHHAVSLGLPCRGKPRPGGAEHNLRLLRKGVNPITRMAFREGPFPEPGSNARPVMTVESGSWGSKGGTWQALEWRRAGTEGRGRSGEPTAQQRLEALRRRVVEKEKKRREEAAGEAGGGLRGGVLEPGAPGGPGGARGSGALVGGGRRLGCDDEVPVRRRLRGKQSVGGAAGLGALGSRRR